jgi:hypothetical protein
MTRKPISESPVSSEPHAGEPDVSWHDLTAEAPMEPAATAAAGASEEDPPAEQRRSAPQRPAHKIRIGRIWGTIWENPHPESGRWFTVNVTRSYEDRQGSWKSATSFGREDLLVVGEVCRLCFLWINDQLGQEGNGSERP